MNCSLIDLKKHNCYSCKYIRPFRFERIAGVLEFSQESLKWQVLVCVILIHFLHDCNTVPVTLTGISHTRISPENTRRFHNAGLMLAQHQTSVGKTSCVFAGLCNAPPQGKRSCHLQRLCSKPRADVTPTLN